MALLARPEPRVMVVAHWGVLYSLLGRSMDNCEVFMCTAEELPPYITPIPGENY